MEEKPTETEENSTSEELTKTPSGNTIDLSNLFRQNREMRMTNRHQKMMNQAARTNARRAKNKAARKMRQKTRSK